MTTEERDPAITQAKKRKKNIANLPKLFDMIRLLLRQRNCITKMELVSKIISSHSDIVDRSKALFYYVEMIYYFIVFLYTN